MKKKHYDYVYVLDINGKPLMPTRKFAMVRFFLKTKRAEIVNYQPFTIRLLYESTHYVQPCKVGVDTGFEYIGVSVSNEKYEYYASQKETRTDIKSLNKSRRELRRNRRQRKTRYRKARFSNRRKPAGWLAPSVVHRSMSHLKEVKCVCSILPVNGIIVEVTSFDLQKAKNPAICGVGYQQGPKYGHQNTREAVLARDKYKCRLCKSTERIESHHIKWLSKGGADSYDNQITLCHKCHNKVHSGEIKLKIKGEKAPVESTVQIFKNRLVNDLEKEFPNITIKKTYGSFTKAGRYYINLEKSHVNDAFVIAGNLDAKRTKFAFVKKEVRRHNRMIHVTKPRKGGERRTKTRRTINSICTRIGDNVTVVLKKNIATGFVSGSTNGRVTVVDIFWKKVSNSVGEKGILKTNYKPRGTILFDTILRDDLKQNVSNYKHNKTEQT